MDEDGKAALEASIEHWKEIVKRPQDARTGITSCALCLMFNQVSQEEGNCEGCPVFEKTCRKWCGGTPYTEFIEISEGDFRSRREHIAALRKAAKAELAFLESLREA